MRKLAAPKGGQLRDTVETKLKERELILQPSLAAHLYRFTSLRLLPLVFCKVCSVHVMVQIIRIGA